VYLGTDWQNFRGNSPSGSGATDAWFEYEVKAVDLDNDLKDEIVLTYSPVDWQPDGPNVGPARGLVLETKEISADFTFDELSVGNLRPVFKSQYKNEKTATGSSPATLRHERNAVIMATPDTDTDSAQLQLKAHNLVYSDPKVLAVVAAPPMWSEYEDNEDFTDHMTWGGTSYGVFKGIEKSTVKAGAIKAGVTIGWEHEFTALGLIPISSAGVEMEFSHTTTWETQQSSSITHSISYSTAGYEDQVAVYTVPAAVSVYEMTTTDAKTGTQTKQDFSVTMPYSPKVVLIEGSNYERLANSCVVGAGLQKALPNLRGVDGILAHTVGDPATYTDPNLRPTSKNILTYSGTAAQVGYEGGVLSQNIDISKSEGHSTEHEEEFSFQAWAGGGGFKAGVTLGSTEMWGSATVVSEGASMSGSIANLPSVAKNMGYDFGWRLAYYEYVNGNLTIPVVSYIVTDTKPHLAIPTEVGVDETESTPYTLDLVWEYYPENDLLPTGFIVERRNSVGVWSPIGYVDYEHDVSTYGFTDDPGREIGGTSLAPGTTYKYRVKANRPGQIPNGSLYSKIATGVTLPVVKLIRVNNPPTTVIVGEELDYSQMSVNAELQSGAWQKLYLNKVGVSPTVFAEIGTETVTVSYVHYEDEAPFTTTFEVEVLPIPTYELTLTCDLEDPNDFEETNLFAAQEEIDITACAAPTGQQFDHWEYTPASIKLDSRWDPETSFLMPAEPVSLVAKYAPEGSLTLVNLEAKHAPTVTSYFVGDSFDPTGLEVWAVYDDESTQDVTAELHYSPSEFATVGSQTVVITYRDTTYPTTEVPVLVESAPILENIAVTTYPEKITYFEGELFDATGMVVTASFAGGDTKVVTEEVSISAQLDAIGDAPVTVTYTYRGVTKAVTFSVAVTTPTLDYLSVPWVSDEAYLRGQSIDPTKLELVAHFTDGSAVLVDNKSENLSFSPTSLLWAGERPVTVSYTEGLVTRSTSFTVKVQADEPDPVQLLVTPSPFRYFILGNELDISLSSYRYAMSDGTTRDVPATDSCAVSPEPGGPLFVPGPQQVTFTCTHHRTEGGETFEADLVGGYEITVLEPIVEPPIFQFLELVNPPKQGIYSVGDSLNLDGLEVLAHYYDGSTRETQPVVAPEVFTYEGKIVVDLTHSESGITRSIYDDQDGHYDMGMSKLEVIVVRQCDSGKAFGLMEDGENYGCIDLVCPVGQTVSGNTCVAITCPPGEALEGDTCMAFTCPEGEYIDGNFCSPIPGYQATVTGGSGTGVYSAGSVVTITAGEPPAGEQFVSWSVITGGVTLNAPTSPTTSFVMPGGVVAVTATYAPIAKVLSGISVTSLPSKTTYFVGQTFDTRGLEVTASYTNAIFPDEVVIPNAVTPGHGADLTAAGSIQVTVMYSAAGVFTTKTFTITVVEVAAESITATQLPSKLEYNVGETLDLSGLEITVTNNNGALRKVSTWTSSPANGSALNTTGTNAILISFTEAGVTLTTTVNVNVTGDGEPSCPTGEELVAGVCQPVFVPPTCEEDEELVEGACQPATPPVDTPYIKQHFPLHNGSGTVVAAVSHSHQLFSKLLLNGSEVGKTLYTTWEGSTYVELSQALLDTLPNGSHTVELHFTDGQTFTLPLTISRSNGQTPGQTPSGTNPGASTSGGSKPSSSTGGTSNGSTNTGISNAKSNGISSSGAGAKSLAGSSSAGNSGNIATTRTGTAAGASAQTTAASKQTAIARLTSTGVGLPMLALAQLLVATGAGLALRRRSKPKL
jgi:hypothetical protein